MLAGLGRHFGWPRADLEGLLAEEAAFWSAAVLAFSNAAQKATT